MCTKKGNELMPGKGLCYALLASFLLYFLFFSIFLTALLIPSYSTLEAYTQSNTLLITIQTFRLLSSTIYFRVQLIFSLISTSSYISILKKKSPKERVSNVDNIMIDKIICTRGYSKDICVFLRFPLFF